MTLLTITVTIYWAWAVGHSWCQRLYMHDLIFPAQQSHDASAIFLLASDTRRLRLREDKVTQLVPEIQTQMSESRNRVHAKALGTQQWEISQRARGLFEHLPGGQGI